MLFNPFDPIVVGMCYTCFIRVLKGFWIFLRKDRCEEREQTVA